MKLSNLVSTFAILGCVGAAVAGAVASEGCTATLTTGGDAGTFFPDDTGTPVVQQDSGSVPPNACNACLYGQCAGLYAICVNDLTCLGIYQCEIACAPTDDTCVNACLAGKPAGAVAYYDNLGVCDYEGECNGGSCAATCAPPASYCSPVVTGDDGGEDSGQDSGGTTADSGPTDAGTTEDSAAPADAAPAQTCTECQATSCATQNTACATGTPCFAYTQCVLGCTTGTCPGICASNNLIGVAAAKALGDCTSTSCAVCALPQ